MCVFMYEILEDEIVFIHSYEQSGKNSLYLLFSYFCIYCVLKGIWLTRYLLAITEYYCNSFDADLNSGGLVDWVKCQHMPWFMPD